MKIKFFAFFLLFSSAVFADGEKDYTDAVGKCVVERKVLVLVVRDRTYDFPKDEKLKSALDASVVVQVDPKGSFGKTTFQEHFKLNEAEVSGGVVLLVDYRDKAQKSFGSTIGRVALEDRTADRILGAFAPPAAALPQPLPFPQQMPSKPAGPAAPAAPVAPVFEVTEYEMALIDEVNAFRKAEKLSPLTFSPELVQAGRNYVGQGKMNIDLAVKAGDRSGYAGVVSPVVAGGKMTPRQVVDFLAKNGDTGKAMRGMIKVNGKWRDGDFTHIGVANEKGNTVIYFGAPNLPRK